MQRFEAEANPLDVLPEVALARALLHHWLDQYRELVDALMAWNDAEAEDAAEEWRQPRPQRIPDLTDVNPLLDLISKIVDRIEKANADSHISRRDFYRVLTEMGRVIDLTVSDEDVRQRIHEGWMKLKLG